jgi:hypothetical protein
MLVVHTGVTTEASFKQEGDRAGGRHLSGRSLHIPRYKKVACHHQHHDLDAQILPLQDRTLKPSTVTSLVPVDEPAHRARRL